MFITQAESAELLAFESITGMDDFDAIAVLSDLCLKAAAQRLASMIGQTWKWGNYYPVVIVAVNLEKLTLDYRLLCGTDQTIDRNYPVANFVIQHQLLKSVEWMQQQTGSSKAIHDAKAAAILKGVTLRLKGGQEQSTGGFAGD